MAVLDRERRQLPDHPIARTKGNAGGPRWHGVPSAGAPRQDSRDAMKRLAIDREAVATRWFGLAATAAAALAGALLWQALDWPLPWVTGALTGAAALAMAGFPVRCPPLLFSLAQWLIGAAVGARITPSAATQLAAHADALLAAAVGSLLLGLALARLLRRWARFDAATALLASLPGVSGEMVRLAYEHGARADHVAIVHTVRLSLVVLLVPPAFQLVQPGMALPLPAPAMHGLPGQVWLLLAALGGGACLRPLVGGVGWFIGALIGVALTTASGLPVAAAPAAPLTDSAQLFLGWSLGSRFTRQSLSLLPRLLSVAAILNAAVIGCSALLGLVLACWSGSSPTGTILGAIPGGVAEMCITAASLGEPVALVAAFHVVRVVALLLLAGPILQRTLKASS